MRAGPEIPVGPFIDLLNRRFTELERAGENAAEVLAEQMGWGAGEPGVRMLYRYRHGLRAGGEEGIKGDSPTSTFPRAQVEDALAHAAIPFDELYPEYAVELQDELEPEVFCPECNENCSPIQGICPWCDTPVAVEAPAPSVEPEVATPSAGSEERLAELQATINDQCARIEAAAKVLTTHAVAIGEALLEAQRLVPPGEWVAWVEANIPFGRHRSMCKNYMRLAALKDYIDPDLSVMANLKLVTGLQRKCASIPRKPAEVKAEAIRLYGTGQFSYAQVAQMVGTTAPSVHAWVDPAYAEQRRAQNNINQRNRTARLRAIPGGKSDDRSHRYGKPGRAALGQAIRKLAKAGTGPYIIEALLDIEAISAAWRERLSESRKAA